MKLKTWITRISKALVTRLVMHSAWVKLNHIIFWWYYKRVPVFFHQWNILRSITLLKQNYEHAVSSYGSLNEVLINASKREIEMREKISNLELKLKGVPQEKIDPINTMFGTNLKGN